MMIKKYKKCARRYVLKLFVKHVITSKYDKFIVKICKIKIHSFFVILQNA